MVMKSKLKFHSPFQNETINRSNNRAIAVQIHEGHRRDDRIQTGSLLANHVAISRSNNNGLHSHIKHRLHVHQETAILGMECDIGKEIMSDYKKRYIIILS